MCFCNQMNKLTISSKVKVIESNVAPKLPISQVLQIPARKVEGVSVLNPSNWQTNKG